MHPRPIHLALSCSLLAALASAQGSDSCSSAQVVVGTGAFAFDNSAATTDGLPDNLCLSFGTAQIELDVWFAWVAPSNGIYQVDTCSQTSVDTRLAIYDGSCAGAVLACNDDTCGLQSLVSFSATAGSTYIVRLGSYPGSPGGAGTFTLQTQPLPQVVQTAINPANGREYRLLETSSWELAEYTATTMGGHLVAVNDAAEQAWIGATFYNQGGVNIDIWIGLTDKLVEGTFVWSNGDPLTYTNWNAGEPNNAGAGEDYAHIAKNSASLGWNDLPDPGTSFHNAPQGLVELGASQPVSYCTVGTTAGGCAPAMSFSGSPSASSASGFTIASNSVDANRTGLFFYALSDPNFVPVQWGIGGTSFLCIKAPTQRMNLQNSGGSSGCTGSFSQDWSAFMAANPAALGNPLLAGATFEAQLWMRDPPAPKTTTLSNALRFTLAP